MAVSNITLCFVLICAVYAANARPMTVQEYHLQSLNRAVEAAKVMYETLAEEQAKAQYRYYHNDAANMQQDSIANMQQDFITKEQQYEQDGVFEQQSDQQGVPWMTDQQSSPPNQQRIPGFFAAGLPEGGPG